VGDYDYIIAGVELVRDRCSYGCYIVLDAK
jgi:hypothetical protein